MAVYLRLSSVPELAGLEGKDRVRVWKLAVKCAGRETWWGRVLLRPWWAMYLVLKVLMLAWLCVWRYAVMDWLMDLPVDQITLIMSGMLYAYSAMCVVLVVLVLVQLISLVVGLQISRPFMREILTAGG